MPVDTAGEATGGLDELEPPELARGEYRRGADSGTIDVAVPITDPLSVNMFRAVIRYFAAERWL